MSEKHDCSGEHLFTVENRGDGWYLYDGDSRGAKPINFCIYCGERLVKEEGRSETPASPAKEKVVLR